MRRKKFTFTQEQRDELNEAYLNSDYAKRHRKIQAVLLRAEGNKIKDIQKITKLSNSHISNLTSRYMDHGLDSLLSDKRTSNHRHMTPAEEVAFLAQFLEIADEGQVVTVAQMHQAYQEKVGKKTDLSSFYDLLHRHNWRKLMPRPRHPKKADAQTIEASKKLTLKSEKK